MPATAAVRIDVKNDTSEACSLAFNVRTDKTKWLTQGWYVFASGEEAPVILDMVSDIHDVFVFDDCSDSKAPADKNAETKKVWVKTDLQFSDDSPRDHAPGYEEKNFERLKSTKYVIAAS